MVTTRSPSRPFPPAWPLEQIKDHAIFQTDPDGRATTWNQGVRHVLGFEEEEFVGADITTTIFTPEDVASGVPEEELAVAAREGIASNDRWMRRKDGRRFWASGTTTGLKDDTGELVGYVKIMRDLTERRNIEDALRLSREMLEEAQRIAHVGSWELELQDLADINANRLRWSNEVYRIFGYQPGERKASNDLFFERVHPEDRDAVKVAVSHAIHEGVRYEIEHRLVLEDGSERTVRERAEVLRTPDGLPLRMVGTVQDITEQVRATRAVRESERRLRFVLDSMPQKIFTAAPDGSVDYFGPQWMEFTGLPFEAIRGWGWSGFVHPDDVEQSLARWQRSIETGEPFVLEHRYRRHDGQYRWHISRALPMRDEAGRVVMWIGSNTEIHEIKEAQEVLREADRRKDELLAMLAHELRNPLAPIVNAVTVLKRIAPAEPALHRNLDIIQRQSRHMKMLLDDLLEVSRFVRSDVPLRQAPVRLVDIVQQAVETSRPLIEAKRQTLRVSCLDEDLVVQADPTRMVQVFANLLNNAAKYTDEGGRIQVTQRPEGAQAVVEVSDSGVGMAPELVERAFDLFSQGDRSLDRSQGGLGLGLTLVRRIVERHGGTVSAASRGHDLGSTFTVRLPIATPQVAESAQEAKPVQDAGRAGAAGWRVLVVDDNRDAADSLCSLLEMIGFQTRMEHTGLTCLQAARRFRPDVVLLDIGLPGMDGYEVARRLRREPETRDALLVAVTGYGQDEDRRRSRDAGFDHHLTKPVELAELQRVLQEGRGLIRGSGRAGEE